MGPESPPGAPSGSPISAPHWDIHAVRLEEVREVFRVYRGLPVNEASLFHPFPSGSLSLGLLLVGLWVGRGILPRFARSLPRESITLALARDPATHDLAALGTLNFSIRPSDRSLAARTGIYVAPRYRRLGAAQAVNHWMLDRARRRGAQRAEALILPENGPSRALFEAMGYRLRPSGIQDQHRRTEEFLLAELDPL
jgi:GNAT superfamily N-acetyltransferase